MLHLLTTKNLRRASAICTALVLTPAVAYTTVNHLKHEEQLGCLAKNVYYESRGEPIDSQLVVAYVTLARSADHTEWGKLPCETVYQRNQFSWTNGIPKEPKGPEWERSKAVAKVAYEDPTRAVPRKALCARYYKRSDDKGVSDRSKRYFGTLKVVEKAGSHTVYCESRK